jgi:hypothetical protein
MKRRSVAGAAGRLVCQAIYAVVVKLIMPSVSIHKDRKDA